MKVPVLNDTIKEMREHDGIKVQKLKACNSYTLALFGTFSHNEINLKMTEASGDGVTIIKDNLVADIESV